MFARFWMNRNSFEGERMSETQVNAKKTSSLVPAKGVTTVVASLLVLIVLGYVFAPSSVSTGAVLGMLPFAAVLAIVGLGQLLVVQQGGIDLSVPGAVSLYVVIISHYPTGDDSRLLVALGIAVVWALGAGVLNAFLIGWVGLNPIIATLGSNALLFAGVLGISGGTPRATAPLLQSIAGGRTFGVPNSIFFALAALALVSIVLKRTVAGRRFEASGASRPVAFVVGLNVRQYNGMSYVWAQMLYLLGGVLLAGITSQPNAYMGNPLLLPSVAVVVLGGTSLLGGRGFPVATVLAALFLRQLDQFVLALGVPFAVRTLVQAAAFTIGVAIYTLDWAEIRRRFQLMKGSSAEQTHP
jgi:ribose transport system permease protein